MAQNVTVAGASYADVPAVNLPKTGGGTAPFFDVSDTTAEASDVAQGKYFYSASGARTLGTASGGALTDAVLLWENDSPTSDFAAYQSVSVNLSDYDSAIIEYSAHKSETLTPMFSRAIPVGDGDTLRSVGMLSGNYGGRFCAVLNDRINFGAAFNHSTTANETVSIPLAVYGTHGGYRRTAPEVSGRTYLVKPYDPYGGGISGFGATKQQNGNAVTSIGWGLSELGLGFTMVTKPESSSYAMMISNESVSLASGKTITINANARGYNGNDYFFLIKKADLPSDIYTATRTAANMYALAAGGAKLDLVSSSNAFTSLSLKIEVNSSSKITIRPDGGSRTSTGMDAGSEFYIALMIAGSTTPFNGFICVKEAYVE